MDTITFAQLRHRIAKSLKSKFNAVFCELYQNNIAKYPNEIMPELMVETGEQTIDFLNNIMRLHNDVDLINLYQSIDSKIICCFYARYWFLINVIEPLSHSDDNKISVPNNDEEMLKALLFGFIEDPSTYQL